MFQGGQIYERLSIPQKICAFVLKQILHGGQLDLLLKLHNTFPEHVVSKNVIIMSAACLVFIRRLGMAISILLACYFSITHVDTYGK